MRTTLPIQPESSPPARKVHDFDVQWHWLSARPDLTLQYVLLKRHVGISNFLLENKTEKPGPKQFVNCNRGQ